MQIHGSLFPEGYPKGSQPVIVKFWDRPGIIVDTLTIHLGDGDLEKTYESLINTADALRQWIDKRDLTLAERAPAGVSEQDPFDVPVPF